MADSIVHRGPNDEGFYDGEGVVLGMRRLSIIDIEGARQPIFNETRDVVVVCNGEIYNFRELRASLQEKGHVFTTDGDVEVVVHLYEEYGDAFVEHLDGMFAIALWDIRRRRLILVRDHLGIKPLYYTDRPGGIAFASEAKALFQLDGCHAGVSHTGLRDYLGIGYCVAPHSIFEGVSKLPPASMLILESGEYRVRRYWSLPEKTEDGVTDEEWADRIHAGLAAAVKAQMVSDVPLGAFLSGGVDSSAIVALMAQNSDRPIKTYSIGYAGSGTAAYYNELSYAKVVADQFATDHHEIEVDPDVVSMLPKLIWHLEEPVSDSALATTYLVSEMAAKTVTVILSGVGGDELFAGYNRYLGEHYRGLYQKIPSWIRNPVLTQIAGRLPSGRQNRWLDLSRYARSFIMSADLPWDERYRHYLEIQRGAALNSMLLDAPALPDGLDRVMAEQHVDDELLRLMRVDCETQMAEDLLLLTDKMTMANSLECRVPFLSRDLTELAARIPARQKCPGSQLKHLLKKALVRELPDGILNRKKRGFGAPVGAWFKESLLPLRNELLSAGTVGARGVLSPAAVEAVCRAHDGGKEDYTDLILVLMNLEVWFRIFIDGESAADVSGQLSENVARNAA
jgi:asparagine synthase (glutamine-hydrolysing)